MKTFLGLLLALLPITVHAADMRARPVKPTKPHASNVLTLPDGSLVIALPPCLPGYMATGPYCVLGTPPGGVTPPPPPPGPPVATLIEPTPLTHGTFTLTGTISPPSPTMVVKIDWYNQSPRTFPPASEPIVTCITNPTGASFTCAREVIDNPGILGYMWMQVNGGPWTVAWSGTPL